MSGTDGGPRDDFARASAPLLRRLARLPRAVILLGVTAWLLTGLFAPAPVGPVVLLLLAAFLGWLLSIGWPAMGSGARLMRLGVVLLLAGVAGSRLADYISN